MPAVDVNHFPYQPRALEMREAKPPKVCLVIATAGRAEILAAAMRAVDAQILPPDLILISCMRAEDVGHLAERENLSILVGPPGLPAQRNTALRHIPADFDIVVFLDDDFVAHPQWIAEAVSVFQRDRKSVV